MEKFSYVLKPIPREKSQKASRRKTRILFKETGVKQSSKNIPEESPLFSLGSKISSVKIDKIDLLVLLKDNISTLKEQILEQEDYKEMEVNLKFPKLTNNFINKYLKDEVSKMDLTQFSSAKEIQILDESLTKGFFWELKGINHNEAVPARKPLVPTEDMETQTLNENKQELEMLRKELISKESEIVTLSTKNDLYQSQILDLNKEIEGLKSELADSLSAMKVHESEIADLSRQISSFNSHKESTLSKERDQNKEIGLLKAKITNLDGEIACKKKIIDQKDEKISSLSSNYKKLEGFIDTVEKENEQNHQQMEELMAEVEKLREKERSFEKPKFTLQIEKLTQEINNLKIEQKEYQAKVRELEQEKEETLSQIHQDEFEDNLADEQFEGINKHLKDTDPETTMNLKLELKALQDENQILKDDCQAYSNEIDNLKKALHELKSEGDQISGEEYESFMKRTNENNEQMLLSKVSMLTSQLQSQKGKFQKELCEKAKTIKELSSIIDALSKRCKRLRRQVHGAG
ncbi:unnamed protein product [Moneuplotes crassus]|uniref:Uncharacterized protein n=1 Tax=Euplotes crassus TaxID=5936 RepID=A0AAD1U6E7_EUPCR|nr:unnamed protein product [Moneuplotes crassus]